MPFSEEDVGKYGLQTSWSVDSLMETKTGISIKAAIIKLIETLEEKANLIKELVAEQQAERELAVLMSRQEDDDKESEMWWLHQDSGIDAHQTNKPPIIEPIDNPKAAMSDFEAQMKTLDRELEDIQKEAAKTAKLYNEYDKSIAAANDFIDSLNPKDKQQTKDALEGRIAKLQKELNKEAEAVYDSLDKGNESDARSKLGALTAKNLQIGTLKDMLSVTKGDKVMFNKDGHKVDSFKDADFVVPKDKKIEKKGNDYYLLGEHDDFDKLSDAQREAAKQDFEHSKQEMSSVKDLIKSHRGIEMTAFDQEISRISRDISKLQDAAKAMPAMDNLSETVNTSPKDLPQTLSQQKSNSETSSEVNEESGLDSEASETYKH